MTEASKVIHNWFYDNCTKCTIKAKTPNDQFKCERGQVFEQEVYDVDTGHDGGLRRKRIHNNSKPNLKSRHVPFYLSTFFLKDFIFQLLNREFIWFMPRFC
ncbi:hypothetical protein MTR_7g083730 [Medicago truncatula]|uniref:Uncharacterized protein n=1 Tax=Medicago truncatula TaxID=3880 RepID=G7KW91_MEDTR|nr:hypothetical protein MTR_7g083730 [Medicago truncatula]